ncbi:hypothetical protein TNCT_403231 [Trichonephila clavata]|uniref:Uncharacterized protein n=1 Tax=Trichonephila clavata TaxID=2740835 RepID=A0A8X6IED7_TRICU|nr:hypothetical protein TNCT_403231 [Trichonephila clavata]
MACAGLLETEIHGGGGGKQSFLCSFPKAIRMPESLKDLVVWKPCCSQSPKYSWTVLNHCFVWMDAFSAQEGILLSMDRLEALYC